MTLMNENKTSINWLITLFATLRKGIDIMLVVEVGFKLNNTLDYYDKLLKMNGLVNDFNVVTHDIYYTNKDLNNLSENEMKNACIRLRSCNNEKYKIQNNLISELDVKEIDLDKLKEFETKLSHFGYKKVFDTLKKDHHYYKDGMNSKVQLQEIDNIGLLVYFDNSNYYEYDLDTQRKKLIDELNSYGFNFNYDELGLDKLRTLYYGKECTSKNQNG